MDDVQFLTVEEVLELHKIQITQKGGASDILSTTTLQSAVSQPKQTFDGEYLHKDLFEMAASYLISIAINHPFMDGNKRTATHAALVFLYQNGYQVEEFYETELADMVYSYLDKKISDEDVANFLADRAKPVE